MGNNPNYASIELLSQKQQIPQYNQNSIHQISSKIEQSKQLDSIVASYEKRLPFYYSQLLEFGLQSVKQWKLKDTFIWLQTIGLSQLYSKFCELGIDGSVLMLLDETDLRNQIGVRSLMTLGILMAWINKGFVEFQNYLFLNKIIQEQNSYCKNIQKIKQLIGGVDFAKLRQVKTIQNQIEFSHIRLENKQQREQISNNDLTYRNRKLLNISKSVKFEGENKVREQNIKKFACIQQLDEYQSISELQVIDNLSNICVKVEQIPFKLISQLDKVYKQYGFRNNSSRKKNTIQMKMPENQEQLFILDLIEISESRRPLSIRNLLVAHQNQRKALKDEKGKQKLIDRLFACSIEVIVTKNKNVNNIDQYRVSLMADSLCQMMFNISQQGSQQSQVSNKSRLISDKKQQILERLTKCKTEECRKNKNNSEDGNSWSKLSESAEIQRQILCYLLLSWVTKIPQLRNNRYGQKQREKKKVRNFGKYRHELQDTSQFEDQLCYLYEEGQDDIYAGALNVWKFEVSGWVFESIFISNTNGPTKLYLKNKQKNLDLLIDPSPKDHKINQFQLLEQMQNQVFSSNSLQIFFLCKNSILETMQIHKPNLYEPLGEWLSQPIENKFQKLATIIYDLYSDQFYLCGPQSIESFIRLKRSQYKKSRVQVETNKKKWRNKSEQQDEQIFYKSKERHKQKAKQMKIEQSAEKWSRYKSNRSQYEIAEAGVKQKNIWIKMPIFQMANKLDCLNSVRLRKGTSIKLGPRQYTFNFCTQIIQSINPQNAYANLKTGSSPQLKSCLQRSNCRSQANNWQDQPRTESRIQKHCIICYEKQCDCIFYDCMHNVTCLSCGKVLDTCPMCRRRVIDYLRVYKN